jgi:hypothetical protein
MASRRKGSRSTDRLSEPMLETLRIPGAEAAMNLSALSVENWASVGLVGTAALFTLGLIAIILLFR